MIDEKIIEQYLAGGEHLLLAIRGLLPEDLFCAVPPADANVGRWSIQQVVIHSMDSDLICTDRLKRIAAEENPTIVGYDENKFADKLFYAEQSAEQAAQIVAANRNLFAGVLRKFDDATMTRSGTHNERGKISFGDYLNFTIQHLEHHTSFIHRKRALMGKEMW